jgi:hypothetical protein
MAAPVFDKPSPTKTFALGAGSGIATMLGTFIIYLTTERFPGVVSLTAMVPMGLVIGCLLGLVAGSNLAKAVGIGAFIGILILWTPVVVVTYGFALLALPLLALYSSLVAVGAKVGGALRRKLIPVPL